MEASIDATSVRRSPRWSGAFTRPLARLIPRGWRPGVLAAIKGLHTGLFISIGGAIVLFVWDGLRGRPRRRAAIAFGVAMAESVVYVSNNQVCPLTPLAVELGAEHGAVADIFLPEWASRRIPVVATSAVVLGIALNLRTLLASTSFVRPAGRMATGPGTRPQFITFHMETKMR